MKRRLNCIALVLVLNLIFLLTACGGEEKEATKAPPKNLPVAEVQKGNASTYFDYPATLEGVNDIEIRPQVDGYLAQVLVSEGAYVVAGQPLFRINEQPFREQLNSAIANRNAAEAALVKAKLEVERLTPLVQSNVVADIQLKTAQATQDVAQAQLEQAKALVANAEINLGYCVITAPVSGYVGRVPKKQGSLVSRNDPMALTKLSDIHDVYAYFSLSESDFNTFKQQYEGNSIEEKVRSVPPVELYLVGGLLYQQKGKIDMVDGSFDKTTGAITLRATFPNPQGLLRSGNTGKIRLPLKHDNVFMVPVAATSEIQDKVFVYVVGSDNQVIKQPISVAGKSGDNYLVTDGIKSGDRIVLKGLNGLQDGETIVPQAAQPEAASGK